ncbi:unnamed protein product, partial [marine sediment metagenome]
MPLFFSILTRHGSQTLSVIQLPLGLIPKLA